MVSMCVVDRDGREQVVAASGDQTLMEALRAADLGVDGTCGGMCACGSCHIYAGEALMMAAPPVSQDEQDMLDGLAEIIAVRPCSRLACQIRVSEALEGTSLEIGPQL